MFVNNVCFAKEWHMFFKNSLPLSLQLRNVIWGRVRALQSGKDSSGCKKAQKRGKLLFLVGIMVALLQWYNGGEEKGREREIL